MRGGFNKKLTDYEMNNTPTFKKKPSYERKRSTVRVYESTKIIIEDIVGNRRDRVKIQEFANASEIYDMLFRMIEDTTVNKYQFVIAALNHYFNKEVKLPKLPTDKNKKVTVKVFKSSKTLIENTMNNDRTKTYTNELFNAIEIYGVIYYVLGEDTENKKELMSQIISDYQASL
ncbi:hypothetical protein [Staphylococcus capitis]|uniref:hypothetical protein n=1 Tax=Staphylococcus capitis TaxID=29388 RepID=UPI002040CF53|nr:hypothetical protein [Staphylococcus capitis]MCM3508965.1 hypothetical protein [Staphylococcus capitis]HEK6547234.1 hypothetical protein [Staphylococcus aureus]